MVALTCVRVQASLSFSCFNFLMVTIMVMKSMIMPITIIILIVTKGVRPDIQQPPKKMMGRGGGNRSDEMDNNNDNIIE